jgi:hypothetical protein
MLPDENQSPVERTQFKQNLLATASFGAIRIDFFEEAVLARIVNRLVSGRES